MQGLMCAVQSFPPWILPVISMLLSLQSYSSTAVFWRGLLITFVRTYLKWLVSQLSLWWWDLLSTTHMLILEVASSAWLFVHPPLPRIQGWLHMAVHSYGMHLQNTSHWGWPMAEPRVGLHMASHWEANSWCTHKGGICFLWAETFFFEAKKI